MGFTLLGWNTERRSVYDPSYGELKVYKFGWNANIGWDSSYYYELETKPCSEEDYSQFYPIKDNAYT